MNFSFNPVHYETPQSFNNCIKTAFIEIAKKENVRVNANKKAKKQYNPITSPS